MISGIDTISRMIRLVWGETHIKPTKLLVGLKVMMSINDELMKAQAFSAVISDGSTFMELTVVTKDQFGNDFPMSYLGVV